MNMRNDSDVRALRESLGPAEKLVDLIINFPDHLWHNRPGIIRNGKWKAATRAELQEFRDRGRVTNGEYRRPGPNVEAIVQVYSALAEIWQANKEFAAKLASYVMKETDWRDMKTVCAAFMLVQDKSGAAIFDEDGGVKELLFHDDDFREVGEAMIKHYERGSGRMMTPKLILRIRDVLTLPAVAELNRRLGFGHPQKRKPFTGRYYKAVEDWLTYRETNPTMLEGLKKAGYGTTVRNLARMVGYKPKSQKFFEVLGWKQRQSDRGHRTIGLENLRLQRVSLAGLSEAEICAKIVNDRLGWKVVMGMLPPELGLTPAICVALLDQFSDKDFAILTPTLEEFGLLDHAEIRARWSDALARLEDQRSRNIAKNVKRRELAERLDQAADDAVRRAVSEATGEADVHIMFLVDISASMEGAIAQSKAVLSNIVQGFPQEKLHIACFNTMGYLMKPRHYSAKGIRHMFNSVMSSGGTSYSSGMAAFYANRVEIPAGADLIVFAVGDEAGETGTEFANNVRKLGYQPSAFAHIVNVAAGWSRGHTVRGASEQLGVPYTEVDIAQFQDVYQVQRTLKAVLEAQPYRGKRSLVEQVMQTELLSKPY